MTIVNMGQDYSSADLSKIKREFGLDKPVKKKYRLSNPMSGGQGYGEIFEASLKHAEVRKLEKSLSSKNKEALSKAIKDKTIKTSKDLISWLNSISESVNEDHHYTFGIGDIVKNKNTSCPHHGSMGIVQKIMKLANDMGMVVKYRVVNSGPTYNPGDSLVKTIDQLEPVQDPAEVEAPVDENK